MQLCIFLVLFGVSFMGSASPGLSEVNLEHRNCPPLWYHFNDRCYKYVSTPMTWAEAELHCVSLKANLVSIHSLEENNFVKKLIQSFDHSEGYTYIGLCDLEKEGSWKWSDGSAVDFVLWSGGQPDNWQAFEHCVGFNYGGGPYWNDGRCWLLYPFVCAAPQPFCQCNTVSSNVVFNEQQACAATSS